MNRIALFFIFLISLQVYADSIKSCNAWISEQKYPFHVTAEETMQERGWCSESYCSKHSAYSSINNSVDFYYIKCIKDHGDSSSTREIHHVHMEAYECTPKPQPEGYLTVTAMTSKQCKETVAKGYYTLDNGTTYRDLYCYVDTCGDLDKVTLLAKTIQECKALSNVKLSLSKSDCSGNIVDWKQGYSGVAIYQACDNTCYLSEPYPLTCEDAAKHFNSTCDPILNDANFKCLSGSPYTLTASCTPKHEKTLASPCDKITADKKAECEAKGEVVADGGTCQDNGVTVTKNTLKCVLKTPDCSKKWHEVLNSSTNTCECKEGYIRNTFGDCWKPLFPKDSNLSDKQKADEQKAAQDNHNARNVDNTNKQTNDALNKLSDKVSSLSNTNAGIRSDLNSTNSLLKSINDKLKSDPKSLKFNSHKEDNNALMKYFGSAKNGLDDIMTSFKGLKDITDKGFSVPSMSAGKRPVFKAVVFHHEIEIKLCSTFSKFRDIAYWLFYLSFLYIGIRIFIFSFLIGV